MFDEAFQTLSAVGGCSLSPKANSDRCEDSTLATAIVANYKIDQSSQSDFKVRMAHEVCACHALEDTILCRHIPFSKSTSLLREHLSGPGFKLIVLELIVFGLII